MEKSVIFLILHSLCENISFSSWNFILFVLSDLKFCDDVFICGFIFKPLCWMHSTWKFYPSILQCFCWMISVMILNLLFYIFSFLWVSFFQIYHLEWFIYFPLLFSISFLYISFWMIFSDYLETFSLNIFVYALI